jgi:dTDP-4-dehydrorhamnose reductase
MVGTVESPRVTVKNVVVVGAAGMLGHDLLEGFRDYAVIGLTRTDLDITDTASTTQALSGADIVINSAAYTAVDDAERNRDAAFAVNSTGARNVAIACRRSGAPLIHVSTDYVFDGKSSIPYSEGSPPNPTTVYGASKLAGEKAVLEEYGDNSIILRTSWLYGVNGNSFPRTILQAGLQRETLDVVEDQWGQPTWTKDVVTMMEILVKNDIHSGIFHGTNSGHTTWHQFAVALFELAGWDTERVRSTSSEAFSRPAPRPAWSVLGHEAWANHGLPSPRPWEEALHEAWGTGMQIYAEGKV